MIDSPSVIDKARALPYPTPFFFTDKAVLKHNYEQFNNLFVEHAGVYYAVKANADKKILALLNKYGASFEAASRFEIDALLDVGVPAERIIYGTSVKPIEHIKRAAAAGVDRFAADSKEEVEKIAVCAPGSRVFVRAIVDDRGSVFTFSERFGAPVSMIKHIILHAKELGLGTYGISFHVGSQAADAKKWSSAIKSITPVVKELAAEGVQLDVINIGGGFPVAYDNHKHAPTLSAIVDEVHRSLRAFPYRPKIIMEPGRGMVATSTVMVAEVISKTVRGGSTWLCVDGGIYNALYEAMMHQGATRYPVHLARKVDDSEEKMECTLAGPTGDSLDIIARGVTLPTSVTVGDRLIFENAGAYTVAMACNFNGFPKPELYLS